MIIVRIWEGLGNQMFQYAYARSLKGKGVDVRLDMKKSYDEVFRKNRKHISRNTLIQNYKIIIPEIDVEKYGKYEYLRQKTIQDKIFFWMGTHSMLKYKFYEEQNIKYSDKLMNLKDNYYVKGWFQNPKYFNDIKDILIKEFVPCKKINILTRLRESIEYKESVSIHIRRCDYVKMHNELSLVYYYKAIEYMKKIYKNPIFIVFSDDIEWVKSNLKTPEKVIYANEEGNLYEFEELFLMSKCSSNIIANSTFSWWAAWLNTYRI